MTKLDLKKELFAYYGAKANKFEIADVPVFNFLMCDGVGDPNNSILFQQVVEALYSVSYTLKFMVKKGDLQVDYGVMPLEGLWWTDNMNNFSMDNKAEWKWTLMIMQPDFITPEMVSKAIADLKVKKDLPQLKNVKFEPYKDGLSTQTLHVGPYSAEPPLIVRLHDFIKANGYKLSGKHREIYLNDMRRTAPERLKTIIRQPMTKL